MREPVIAAYTIGQTPRPDLTRDLADRLPSVRFEVVGALDGLSAADIPDPEPGGYPLETRLRDGTRVVVDSAFLEPRLQAAVSEQDDRVAAHLVLCAGPFPELTAQRPLIRPFEASVAELRRLGMRSVEVVVPFAAQAAPAANKWEAAGFRCRPHAIEVATGERPVEEWVMERLEGTDADALVFDYVGLPSSLLDQVAAAVSLPVFDLGHLAMDRLEKTLRTP
jgi:hypothetical protein